MTNQISSILKEERMFQPSQEFVSRAEIKTQAQYEALYKESVEDPQGFWARQARENLSWDKPFTKTLKYDFESIGSKAEPYLEWFADGELNVSYNCLDRHLNGPRRNKAAFIWQGDRPEERRTITYQELHREVCRLANVLKKHGVKAGSRVSIFLPMIPELPISVLACARIGAIHSVVFSAFSAESLRSRIEDCQAELVITADAGYYGGKVIELKAKVDTALEHAESVRRVLVVERAKLPLQMKSGRDFLLQEEMAKADISNDCPAQAFPAEQPLFILYTSGSTGKPKGVLHTSAGYLLQAHLTFKYIFDIKDEDLFWCTADVGWITGHSYLIYGPLSNGASMMMYEGVPTHPEPDRFWRIIAENRVSIFYTAPTAIRALMRLGEEHPAKHNLSSLRLIGSVGEPINPEAWMWYHKNIGRERCPIVDTWWQTETGGILISTLPAALPTKPGSAGKAFFGVVPQILKQDGSEAELDVGGSLVLSQPWPGMLRGVYGDSKHELIKQVYFSAFPGKYFTGDGCRRDKDGYYWLLGRIDDVINVSGHRLATAEIESALVSHAQVAEAAVVGYPHEIKGQGIYCFVTLKAGVEHNEEMRQALVQHVRNEIGPIATPEKIQFAVALPKTRSGKIMRRILRKIAEGQISEIGDISTLADPSVVESLLREAL